MSHTIPTIFNISLAKLPMPAKLLFTAVLLTLGTGYIFAIANIALKVGFTSEEVATKYYGNEASRQAVEDIENQAGETEAGIEEGEEFSFDDLDEQEGMSDEPIVPIPTFETLVAEGHFHLFGYTSIFFLCGLILLFAEIPGMLKNILIVAPFAASVLDIWSILLTRFVGPGFAWMLIISGMVMALSFLLVFVIGIYQLWFLKSHTPTPEAS